MNNKPECRTFPSWLNPDAYYAHTGTGSVCSGRERIRDFLASDAEDFEDWANGCLEEIRKSKTDLEIEEWGEWCPK